MKIVTPVRLLTLVLLVTTAMLVLPLYHMFNTNVVDIWLVLLSMVGGLMWMFTIILLMITYIERGDFQDMYGNRRDL
jgi:hypothetical protein